MQSTAPDVDAYLKEVPEERRETLEKLRKLCLEILEGYEEVMTYGMPGYRKNTIPEVSFNSQKNYISLYILKKDVLDRYRQELKGVSIGKGCIRYTKPEKMDFDLIKKMLMATKESSGTIC